MSLLTSRVNRLERWELGLKPNMGYGILPAKLNTCPHMFFKKILNWPYLVILFVSWMHLVLRLPTYLVHTQKTEWHYSYFSQFPPSDFLGSHSPTHIETYRDASMNTVLTHPTKRHCGNGILTFAGVVSVYTAYRASYRGQYGT